MNNGVLTEQLKAAVTTRRYPATRVSSGGIDEIDPDDIVYGEYAGDYKDYNNWLDVIYLDDDILRTFSGSVNPHHPVIEELKVILRDEDTFYVVPIRELPLGLAFKRTDIVDIKVTSAIRGNAVHAPSCVWRIQFRDGNTRTLEIEYQAYFAYGNTIRPKSMTNASILDSVFLDNKNKGSEL